MEKTNTGLVIYAEKQLGRPYWYGTYGQTATKALYEGKKKQYPQYYTAKDFEAQLGQRVHDCSGIMEGYLMSEDYDTPPKYNKAYDYSANGLRNACKEKGTIDTIPEQKGVLVFYVGHVGVYVGNGDVIEARGHAYGVVKTKLDSRPWKWWGRHPDILYLSDETAEKTEATVALPVLKNKSKGNAVKSAQRLLRAEGYDVGEASTDGAFGRITEAAVKKYQQDRKLSVSGIIDEDTWNKLLKG